MRFSPLSAVFPFSLDLLLGLLKGTPPSSFHPVLASLDCRQIIPSPRLCTFHSPHHHTSSLHHQIFTSSAEIHTDQPNHQSFKMMQLALKSFFFSLISLGFIGFALAAPYIPNVPDNFLQPEVHYSSTTPNEGEYDDHCKIKSATCTPGTHGPHVNVDCHERGGMMPSMGMRDFAEEMKTVHPDESHKLPHHTRTPVTRTTGGLVQLCIFNNDAHKDTVITNLQAGQALWSIENKCCHEEDGLYCRGGRWFGESVDGLEIQVAAINVGEDCRALNRAHRFKDAPGS